MRRVNPRVYTKDYYLNDCSGYDNWKQSCGKDFEPRFKRIIKEIPSVKNLRILDIGCGRGELAFWCAREDAKEVIGIDYSKNAINLANEALIHYEKNIREKVSFKVGDGKDLKFRDKSFDAVLLTEVLEHMYPEEQELMFNEISRVLRDDGFVFIHTAPSRLFNDFIYKYWCYPAGSILVLVNNLVTGKKYSNMVKPSKLRSYYHKIMHVNEPDYFMLRNLFEKSGFIGEIRSSNVTVLKPIISWKDSLFNLLIYLYPISNKYPFNIIWGNDFYALLKKN